MPFVMRYGSMRVEVAMEIKVRFKKNSNNLWTPGPLTIIWSKFLRSFIHLRWGLRVGKRWLMVIFLRIRLVGHGSPLPLPSFED